MQFCWGITLNIIKEEKNIFISSDNFNVRSKPNTTSIITGTIYNNHDVKIIENKVNWILVEYFDYITCTSKIGWILNENISK